MKPLILQRYSVPDELILLDSEEAQPVRTTRADDPLDPPSFHLSGLFEELGGETVLFFRSEGSLCLRHGDRLLELDLATSRHAAHEGRRTLTIVRGGEVILSLPYPETELGPDIPSDVVPFREEEDRDFGLFIHNVLSDPDRRSKIWRRE